MTRAARRRRLATERRERQQTKRHGPPVIQIRAANGRISTARVLECLCGHWWRSEALDLAHVQCIKCGRYLVPRATLRYRHAS